MTHNKPTQEKQSYFSTLSPAEQGQFREWGDLFSLSNNKPPEGAQIGTVVMPTGDWLDRLNPSIDYFRQQYAAQATKPHLVISGANSINKDRIGASAPRLLQYIRHRFNIPDEEKERIIAEDQSQHAGQQAQYVYEMVKSGKIAQPLVLIVSAYHLPRMYSTIVKTIIDNEGDNLKTKLYAIPVHKDWKGQIPKEPEKVRRDQIIPEMERVHAYRNKEKPDVATREELEKYVGWLNVQNQII